MLKTADDHALYQSIVSSSLGPQVLARPAQDRIDRLHLQAAFINRQLQQHEAMRMSQTIEGFGGPGTERSRYVRAVMRTPYSVNPLLPYMAGGGMGPMGVPPGAGVYDAPPGEEFGVEPGFTRTASVNFAERVGREMAKTANTNSMFEEDGPPPNQYVHAVDPLHTQQDGHNTAGHAIKAVANAVGSGVRDWMSQEAVGGQRWGTGMPPAAMTNEYGQPIY